MIPSLCEYGCTVCDMLFFFDSFLPYKCEQDLCMAVALLDRMSQAARDGHMDASGSILDLRGTPLPKSFSLDLEIVFCIGNSGFDEVDQEDAGPSSLPLTIMILASSTAFAADHLATTRILRGEMR